jgi:hypothetical protein
MKCPAEEDLDIYPDCYGDADNDECFQEETYWCPYLKRRAIPKYKREAGA